MRLIIALGLFVFLLTPQTFAEQVMYVTDGDTLRLVNGQRIRIFGIDAPELSQQPYGVQSKQYLVRLVKDKDVEIVECVGKSYNRRVCSLVVNGQDVGKQMVLSGWAWDSVKFSKGLYQQEQLHAQQEKVGIWSIENLESPWDYRKNRKIGTRNQAR